MQNRIIEVLDPASVMPDELIKGDGGEIEIKTYDDEQSEAESLAAHIGRWLAEDQISAAEVAVLVPRLAEQYCGALTAELHRRGIPFRNDQQLQDLSVEPLTRLIIDYLLVLFGSREPAAYTRLMELLTSASYGEEEDATLRNTCLSFLRSEKQKLAESQQQSFESVWGYAEKLLSQMGEAQLVGLSPDYETKSRFEEVIEQVKSRLHALVDTEPDVHGALTRFGEDRAVRIMTIHKSKGLEFDSVIMLGVEEEAYWADPDEERCLFFVGISRAKRRLILTHSEYRERPLEWTKMWHEGRTRHSEFLGCAQPFV